MNKTYRRWIPLAVVAGLFACGDGRPTSSNSDAPPSSPITRGRVPSDVPRRENPERLCDPLPQRGAEIPEYTVAAEAPPALGGSIEAGTYILTALEAFTGPPPPSTDEPAPGVATNRAGRVTLYVTHDALRFNQARTESSPLSAEAETRGYTYVIAGPKLALLSECPTSGDRSSLSYTAAGNELTLYADSTHREVYTRLP